jgi:hypothetical protein
MLLGQRARNPVCLELLKIRNAASAKSGRNPQVRYMGVHEPDPTGTALGGNFLQSRLKLTCTWRSIAGHRGPSVAP